MHYLRIGRVSLTDGKVGAPKMILVHGFGGGCLMLFRILKPLAEFFEVCAIDLLGMGG